MVYGLLIVLGFQLLGELLVVGMALPVPGPVLGMLFLTLALIGLKTVPNSLRTLSSGLLSNLALLFVPAGVGLILHFELLAREWWIILLALILSSAIATLVTAALFRFLMKRSNVDG